MSKLLSIPIIMKLDIQFTDEPDLESDITTFCSEACRAEYVKTHTEYTDANFFFETISDDGPENGQVTCSQCKETKTAPE